MKTCSKCGIIKSSLEFYKDIRGKQDLYAKCKECHNLINIKNREKQIKQNPWLCSYFNAKARCKNKNHPKYHRYGGRGIKFLMIKDDFKFLWFRDKAYLLKRPSIDRKDNDGNYELNNCRFIEFYENKAESNINSINVRQLDRKRRLIAVWSSLHEAERKLGIAYQNIWKCINNKRKTAGGFIWEKMK